MGFTPVRWGGRCYWRGSAVSKQSWPSRAVDCPETTIGITRHLVVERGFCCRCSALRGGGGGDAGVPSVKPRSAAAPGSPSPSAGGRDVTSSTWWYGGRAPPSSSLSSVEPCSSISTDVDDFASSFSVSSISTVHTRTHTQYSVIGSQAK